jgi:hypothetical protein
MPEETITVGKYRFTIKENELRFGDRIFSKTFKIGGDYDDCVNLAYIYRDGIPIEAKLPHLMYEPECAVGAHLERGTGSELMIKTLIRYGYNKIQNINLFYFDDMSSIDCIEKNMSELPPRKAKKPLKLSMLSIAYNSETWYEKHFNATMRDKTKYTKYREKVKFLEDKTVKESFERFLEIAQPPVEQIEKLEKYYKSATTYRQFFKNIPFEERCMMLLPWLENFMMYYLRDVYSDLGWEININEMDKKKGGHKNKTRRLKRLYPKSYKMINYVHYSTF